ncbi:ras-related and estrogen-regulated growth inhibitor-like [Mercenaria mercenaria]|uniref:ras-related and estrogen-regulated growth inhibitor-like n=2 Tax=Mercenaria mercenaria TaxID=6596 RepID=UPI00234F7ADD|nr:ras-related and estrogen-regulated growth inhibitor-like [Mercenaria mercenaria]
MSMERLIESTRAGQRCPKPLADIKQPHCGGKEINVLVLGKRSVGKTALIVRYLTKRFIGDYNSELEILYSHCTVIDGKHVTLHIIDTLGQVKKEDVSEEQVKWADCVVIVYAIVDRNSFDIARSIAEHIQIMREDNQVPIGIVANKSDLIDRKEVSDTDLSRTCAEFNLLYFETSASEARASVLEVFTVLARQVRMIMKKREKLTRFMSNPAVAAKLQIQQSLRSLAEKTWRSRTSTL